MKMNDRLKELHKIEAEHGCALGRSVSPVIPEKNKNTEIEKITDFESKHQFGIGGNGGRRETPKHWEELHKLERENDCTIGKTWGKLGNNSVDVILEELRPFFEDACNHLGIYEESAKKLCELKGWKRT